MRRITLLFNTITDFINKIPVTTLIVVSIALVAVAIFITWKIAMRNANKHYERDIFGESDYNWKVARYSKDFDDTKYRKKLDSREKEITVWKALYEKYGKNLITFGFMERNVQTAHWFNENHVAKDELLIEVELFDDEKGKIYTKFMKVKIENAKVSLSDTL